MRKRPFLMFGLPFLSIMVASSFALQTFTQTRYDYHASKVQTMSWEEELGIKNNRKKIDLREEYYVSGEQRLRGPCTMHARRTGD